MGVEVQATVVGTSQAASAAAGSSCAAVGSAALQPDRAQTVQCSGGPCQPQRPDVRCPRQSA